MGGILSSLLNSAGSLSVYTREFAAIQNNIANANTPGYASQDLSLVAQLFDPHGGASGGVTAGPLISSRSEYLEQNIRNQQQLLGSAQQMASDLGQVQPLFAPNASGGVPTLLSSFFNSFSQLSVNPNDSASRQAVLTAASQVARGFNEAANGISQTMYGVNDQTRSTVDQINHLAAQIAQINQHYQSNISSESDPGLDAQMHNDLETLSTLANYSVVRAGDGTYGIYLGGQIPLVLGNQTFGISQNFSSGQTVIQDSQGNDITSHIGAGSLGAMLQESNTILPGYMAQLNTLAQTFADGVNGQLAQGVDLNGNAPALNLFTYDQPGDAAATLAVNPLTPDRIAAASAGAAGGNGNAIAVSQLANQPLVNGFTFTQAFGNLSARVGNDVSAAQQNESDDQYLVAQAQQQRQAVSGVDLNAEAAKVLQFQQAYQAVGQFISILNGMTQTLLNILTPGAA